MFKWIKRLFKKEKKGDCEVEYREVSLVEFLWAMGVLEFYNHLIEDSSFSDQDKEFLKSLGIKGE